MNARLYRAALKNLRTACRGLADGTEGETCGHPTFRAGKRAFAVLEEYDGSLAVAACVGLVRQEQLLADHRFYETPYCGHRGWVSLRLAPTIDWAAVRGL